MLAFAFDVGNGFVKARNSKRNIIAPSIIAKEENLGASSLIGISDVFESDLNIQTYESNLDHGTAYVWGAEIKDAINSDSLIHTYTHEDRYNQTRYKLLASFVLAELASDYNDNELQDVVLVTGLPSQEIGTADAKQLKEFLQQTHVVTRNGKQYVINVTDVRLIEQPLGTLLNEYMNDSGQIHKDLLTSTVTLIDFGAGTTILDTFKNLKRIEDLSDTEYEGINDIHKRIVNRLEKDFAVKGIDMTHVQEGFQNDTFIAKISDRKIYPFEDIAKDVVIDFVNKRISNIDSILTSRNAIDKFILTGGGVNVVGEYFQEVFKEHVDIVNEPQLSNVNGFYKLADSIAAKPSQNAM